MMTVNPHFVLVIIDPLAGGADDDSLWPRFKDLDCNDSEQVRAVIREMIVPYVRGLSNEAQRRVKLALTYYLTVPELDFGRIFDANMPPFDAPDDPRDFFVWAWEECFPNESFRLENPEQYEVKSDISEPLKY